MNKDQAPVGTRGIFSNYFNHESEHTVLEWSPSGKRVRLCYPGGPEHGSWLSEHSTKHMTVIEVLPLLKPAIPQNPGYMDEFIRDARLPNER